MKWSVNDKTWVWNAPSIPGEERLMMRKVIMSAIATAVSFALSLTVLGAWPVTVNTGDDEHPEISGRRVVWYGFDGNDSEIFLYDGKGTIQLTNNAQDDWNPQIDGRRVA